MLNTNKTIISDVISMFVRKKIYAKKGERVKVISISGLVAIVENQKGDKFQILISNLL